VKRRFAHVKRMTHPHKRASPEVEDTSAIFKAKANDLKLRMDEVYTTSLLQLSFYSFTFHHLDLNLHIMANQAAPNKGM
jgi:hypothetical protein